MPAFVLSPAGYFCLTADGRFSLCAAQSCACAVFLRAVVCNPSGDCTAPAGLSLYVCAGLACEGGGSVGAGDIIQRLGKCWEVQAGEWVLAGVTPGPGQSVIPLGSIVIAEGTVQCRADCACDDEPCAFIELGRCAEQPGSCEPGTPAVIYVDAGDYLDALGQGYGCPAWSYGGCCFTAASSDPDILDVLPPGAVVVTGADFAENCCSCVGGECGWGGLYNSECDTTLDEPCCCGKSGTFTMSWTGTQVITDGAGAETGRATTTHTRSGVYGAGATTTVSASGSASGSLSNGTPPDTGVFPGVGTPCGQSILGLFAILAWGSPANIDDFFTADASGPGCGSAVIPAAFSVGNCSGGGTVEASPGVGQPCFATITENWDASAGCYAITVEYSVTSVVRNSDGSINNTTVFTASWSGAWTPTQPCDDGCEQGGGGGALAPLMAGPDARGADLIARAGSPRGAARRSLAKPRGCAGCGSAPAGGAELERTVMDEIRAQHGPGGAP